MREMKHLAGCVFLETLIRCTASGTRPYNQRGDSTKLLAYRIFGVFLFWNTNPQRTISGPSNNSRSLHGFTANHSD
ncbi:hypothetical protein BKA64DRAFT_650417, partial [Cadophora sp. MPI-SDFR-AT-0126]